MSTENKIDSKTARRRLSQRREPYWYKLVKGGYVGFRRTADGGNWVVRYRQDKKQRYSSFGDLSEYDPSEQFDQACKQAREWIQSLGVKNKARYKVSDMIEYYADHLRVNNSEKASKEVKGRLKKHVIPELGEKLLTKLTKQDIEKWKKGMVKVSDDPETVRRSKDTTNRILTMLKAGLNLAFSNEVIGTDKAWKHVKPFNDVGEARKVFLDESQSKRLLGKTKGNFHDLIKSALLTGARYSELTKAVVSDLDIQQGTLRLSTKKGKGNKLREWDCVLGNEALSHFKKLAKDKLPNATLHIHDSGEPWGAGYQWRPMQEAIKKAKLPTATTFYALRHTYISRALKHGISVHILAKNCGTSVRMIEKHYGKFMQSDIRDELNKVSMT